MPGIRARTLVVAGVVAAGLAAAGTAEAATVRVGDNWFSPKRLTVEQHSSVTWKFVGDREHRVKVTSGPQRFKSPLRSSGKYVRHMMYRGTYKIVCTVHRETQKMTLAVE